MTLYLKSRSKNYLSLSSSVRDFFCVYFSYLQCLEIEGHSILLVLVQVMENDKIDKWQEGIQI